MSRKAAIMERSVSFFPPNPSRMINSKYTERKIMPGVIRSMAMTKVRIEFPLRSVFHIAKEIVAKNIIICIRVKMVSAI
jgi:hypothetical protein